MPTRKSDISLGPFHPRPSDRQPITKDSPRSADRVRRNGLQEAFLRKLHELRHSLAIKVTAITVGIIIAGFGALLLLTIRRDIEFRINKHHETAQLLAASITTSIQNGMLEGRPDIIRRLVQELKVELKNVRRLNVYRRNGAEAFGDFETVKEVERVAGLDPEVVAHILKMPRKPGARIRHPSFTRAVEDVVPQQTYDSINGTRVLTFFQPLKNGKACQECHGKGHQVRGVIEVSLGLEKLDAELHEARTHQIVVALLTILGVSITGMAVMGRVVLRPIARVAAAAQRIGKGEFDTRVSIKSSDEIGQLGKVMNETAARLKKVYGELESEITERKLAEEEIRRSLERIRAIREIDLAITSTLDLKAVLDVLLEKVDLTLSYAAATIRLWNQSGSDLEPVAFRKIKDGEWKERERKAGNRLALSAVERKGPIIVESVYIDPRTGDREFFRDRGIVSYLGLPLIVKGEVLGVLSLYTSEEVSFEQKEVEFLMTLTDQAAIAIQNSRLYEETKKQAAALDLSNKVKDEFLSIISHELRTPLSAVMGYATMMQDGALGELKAQQGEALRVIENQTKDLLTMINSILDATKMETGSIEVERQQVDLNAFLEEMQQTYKVPLNKDVELVWECPGRLHPIETDAGKLKQILQNLINNAIKFTDRGRVTISARHLLELQSVEFQVTDTGMGIPQEIQPLIFERFRQGDSSDTRRHGGVGLGLYIVKTFATLLEGTVGVESDPGRGSRFTVRLPA